MKIDMMFKFQIFLIGVLFFSVAQAKWFYTGSALTNDAPSDSQCKFSASLVSLQDGEGKSITGWQITSKNAKSAKKIDFTTVEEDTEYPVISVSASEFAQTCCEFIGPDVFDLSTNMFTATVPDSKGNLPTLYVTNIVISSKVTHFPSKWALRTPLRVLKPDTFPYLKSFDNKCFSGCTNFQADASLLINPAVTNIGSDAFFRVPIKGDLTLENLQMLGASAFSFNGAPKGLAPQLESVSVAGSLSLIPASCFKDSCNLKKADFSRCSNLTCILDNAFSGCTNLVSDISLIVNPRVTKIGTSAFKNAPVSGKLILPKIQEIWGSAFHMYDVKKNAGLEAIELSPALTNLISTAFDYQSKLGVVTFGSKKLDFVANSLFTGCSSLTNVWLKGYCPSVAVLDFILAGVPSGPKCIIYASTNLVEDMESGVLWTSIASEATDTELAALSEEVRARCFGVYVNSSKQRKAYLVHRPSPYDPAAGVTIMVR